MQHNFYAFTHPADGAGGIVFLGCPSVCVYMPAGPALAFWWPYANKNLAAPDHHKSQSVTIKS